MDSQIDEVENKELAKKSHHKIHRVLIIVGIVVVFLGGLFGAYVFGTSRTQETSMTQSPAKTSTQTTSQAQSFHNVVDAGYPFLQTNRVKVTTNMAVPNRLQAISVNSSIQDQGYTDVLANKFNEEIGRWKFGNPATVDDPVGDVSIIHIGDDWLAENNPDANNESSGHPGFLFDYDMTTTAAKKASLKKITDASAVCAKDNSKGFTISGFMQVCATFILGQRQAVGVYDPYLEILGLGVQDSGTYVIVGTIKLVDPDTYTQEQADKNYSDAQAGNIPAATTARANEYVKALSNTTMTFEPVQN
jgi:hypothetical protein